VKVAVTGATGLIGSRLVSRLSRRGDQVTVLSRDPERASALLGVDALRWDAGREIAPAAALRGREGVVHLAGENVAQRWSTRARRAIRSSRVDGTRNLVAGLRATDPRPAVLVCASAVGYYGPRGVEPVDESAAPGSDFLAEVTKGWEAAAEEAAALATRVVRLRTGVVLDRHGGALRTMLPPFRAGVGGPVAGGRQYVPWIHADDVVGMIVAALDDPRWSGPVNATAPAPVDNREFSRALGRALHRPALVPVPALALRALYGEMAEIVTGGQRALPARALELGYRFQHPQLDEALRSALRG
jgi:uncharacterized protein (TIGR01777 family)